MIDFSQVKKWIIPEGEVKKVVNVLDSTVLWQAIQRVLKEWRGLSPLTCTPTVAGEFEEVKVYGQSKQQLLPDGYTQLEYTRNTDSTFIDTGIIPSDNTILKVRYRQNATKPGSNYIFASRANSSSTIYGIGGASSGARISSSCSEASVTSDITRESNVIYTVEASYINGVNTLTVIDEANNVTDTKSTTYDWSPQDTTFKFYGWNSANCMVSGTDVFEVEIIQNGVSVYHAYPCQQGENVGFYDIVGNTFTPDVILEAGNTAPTPTAPIEVESVGDRTKNLFNPNQCIAKSGTGTIVVNSDGSLTVTPARSVGYNNVTTNTNLKDMCPNIEANKTYYLSATTTGDQKYFYLRGSSRVLFFNREIQFTEEDLNNAISLYSGNTTDTATISNIMLSEGLTPTPYEPYGYKVPVMVGGKNLFDKNDTSSYIAGYLESNGTIATNNGYTILLECKPNTTYTFSRKESSNRYRVGSTPRLKENIKVNTSGITLISSKRVDETVLIDTFTTTSDAKTLVIWVTNTSDLSVLQSQLNQIQIEEGTQATEYQPYIAPTTTNIYLSEPLRKIGEYADTLSVDGTNVTVTRNIAEVVLDGSETIITASGMVGVSKVLSPERERQSRWYRRGLSNYGICGSASEAGSIYIEIDQTQTWFGSGFNLTPDSLRTLLLQNNCISYYPVATPTTEAYTIESPIMALDNTSIITVDTTVPPSEVYASEYVEE